MVDFANSFPDVQIFMQLGDDVVVTDTAGARRTVKGTFDFAYEEEELGDRLSLKVPTFNVLDEVAESINKGDLLKYNNITYSIYNRNPIDTGITQLVLRSVRSG